MATNKFLTIADISYQSADVLHNILGFTKNVNRQYDDRFAKTGAKIGDTVAMRLPGRFRYSTGNDIDIQALDDKSMPLVLDTLYQRSFAVNEVDFALSLDDFTGRYLKPALYNLASQIDGAGLAMAKRYANNAVGTPGSGIASQDALLGLVGSAREVLVNNQVPVNDKLHMTATPGLMAKGFQYLTQVFNPQTAISEQYLGGRVYNAGGFDWMENQQVPRYTPGIFSGSGAVTTANQSGSVINTGSWGASTTLDVGAIVTFAGVNAINPDSKEDLGVPAQFTITAKNAAGATQALQISPEMVGPGSARQNVSALPGSGALVTVLGTTGAAGAQMGIAFHENAFVFGTADLPTPKSGADSYRASVPELNLSLTVTKQYDIRSNQTLMRMDLLGGWSPLYPFLATKVLY